MNDKEILRANINKLHTTVMGADRICRNLGISAEPVEYCKGVIMSDDCNIYRQGKNFYCERGNEQITVNAYSYTIITAHIIKRR